VLDADRLDVVAQFGQRGGGRRTGQTATDDNDVVLPLVVGGDQLQFVLAARPLLVDGTIGHAGVKNACLLGHSAHDMFSSGGPAAPPVAEVKSRDEVATSSFEP